MSHHRKHHHITIDISLQHQDVVDKLKKVVKNKEKVRSVHILARHPMETLLGNETIVSRILQVISRAKRLTHLKVDLAHCVMLPISSLIALLEKRKTLRRIDFQHLELSGATRIGLGRLRKQLQSYTSLENLQFVDCRGTVALETFVDALPSLKVLRLVCMHGITDTHMLQLLTMAETTFSGLTELHIVSPSLTAVTGISVCKVLGNLKEHASLTKLTLRLDWEQCGTVLANLIHAIPTLEEVDFVLYGKGLSQDLEEIVSALKNKKKTKSLIGTTGDFNQDELRPSQIRSLRLSLEHGPTTKINWPELFPLLDEMLDTNEVLQEITLDDGVKFGALPTSVKTKLLLNRCQAGEILRCQGGSNSQLMDALITHKEHINVTFALLCGNPSICQSMTCDDPDVKRAPHKNKKQLYRSFSTSFGKLDDIIMKSTSTGRSSMFPHDQHGDGSQNTTTSISSSSRAATKKGLRGKVMSIFARSA